MSYYLRFMIAAGDDVTLQELDLALKGVSAAYDVKGDGIYFEGVLYGIVEINHAGDGILDDDVDLLCRLAEKRRGREQLMRSLRETRTMITVQPISHSDNGSSDIEWLSPLWEWLWKRRQGILAVEGGSFFGPDGPIK